MGHKFDNDIVQNMVLVAIALQLFWQYQCMTTVVTQLKTACCLGCVMGQYWYCQYFTQGP